MKLMDASDTCDELNRRIEILEERLFYDPYEHGSVVSQTREAALKAKILVFKSMRYQIENDLFIDGWV